MESRICSHDSIATFVVWFDDLHCSHCTIVANMSRMDKEKLPSSFRNFKDQDYVVATFVRTFLIRPDESPLRALERGDDVYIEKVLNSKSCASRSRWILEVASGSMERR